MRDDMSRGAAALFLLCCACGGGSNDGGGATSGSGATGAGGGSSTGGSTTGSTGASSTTGGSTTGGSTGASSSGGGPGDTCAMPASDNVLIQADPMNNYSFSSTLSFPPVLVMPDAELTFDWSAVDRDFLGHPLDPLADIDTVNLMLWSLTEEELQAKLNNDALEQRDLAVIATVYTQKALTSTSLFDFTSVGTVLTPCQILPFVQAPNPDPNAHPECEDGVGDGFDPATHTYTVMIASGEVLGQGTRMIQAFKLDPESTTTNVVVDSSSTQLQYSVDLSSLQPLQVPVGTADITIDWSDITVNALGNEFVPTNIDEVMVGHYSLTPAELEDQFLDLELIADNLWRGEVPSDTNLALTCLKDEAGEPFTGIDGTGTWIIALVCGSCQNPAPWYLSTLTPGP